VAGQLAAVLVDSIDAWMRPEDLMPEGPLLSAAEVISLLGA
jgi:hypothetical protein